ncbi:MAG: hypothetical protein WA160_14630 [Pseudobdellovibrio sp.]
MLNGVHQSDLASIEAKASSEVSKSAAIPKKEYRGPIDDCLLNSYLYSRQNQILADCTLNYVHLYPNPEMTKNLNTIPNLNHELRIGSFNLLHLGDNHAPLKNFSLVANIMNQWDIVGAQELMPLASDIANNNYMIGELIKNDTDNSLKFPFENWQVQKPGYFKLLQELQLLDPTWAVILQSMSAGEGGSGEMAGFYYRSSRVELKEWNYCLNDAKNLDVNKHIQAKNLGCLVKVPDERQKLISRTAFSAYFKSGHFDFVGLTTHIRYRPSQNPEDVKKQAEQICSQYKNSKNKKCSMPNDDIGRYYEVLTIADQIADIKLKAKDKDVIFMGDFNLQVENKTIDYWKAALLKAPGLVVFQSDKSTLSSLSKNMASNYDHFIFDQNLTKVCDSKKASVYNFVSASKPSDDPVLKEIGLFLKPEVQTEWVLENTKALDNLILFETKKSAQSNPIRGLNNEEKKEIKDKFARAWHRMQLNEYSASMELISDHIPIEMRCKTDQQENETN